MKTIILFDTTEVISLMSGIVYYKSNPILELEDGTYDIWYILELLDQCKYISKTVPTDITCI